MSKPTILLVHGACHGAWCWARLAPLLEAAGHKVIAPDLPGRGTQGSPGWWQWRLADYAMAIVAAARASGGPVVAVGHSMGGQVISAAAEMAPEAFAKLVYLTAFLPVDGDSITALARLDKTTDIATATRVSLLTGQIHMRPAAAQPVFYGDCSDRDYAWARQRFVAEPARPSFARLRLTERFQSIPRAYIRCTADRAISIAFQDKMLERQPCQQVATLAASHSPFLSMPQQLADTLLSLI